MIKREGLVSVIIPFYCNIQWLEEALQSVENQTYKKYEIIVINDGSKEDISNIMKRHNNCKYIFQDNSGPANARNNGIGKARGEYIAFLDSDDLWRENKLEVQIGYMKKTKALWTYTGYYIFSGDHKQKKAHFIPITGNIFPQCLVSNPIATPTVMIDTDFLKRNENIRFPSDMRYGQDGFMWASISRKIPIEYIPLCLTKVRNHGNNSAKRAIIQIKVKAQFWEKLKDENIPYYKISTYLAHIYYFIYLIYKNVVIHFPSNILYEYIARIIYAPLWMALKIKTFGAGRKK